MKGYNRTHAIAMCLDCGWRDEGYKTAQKEGRRHAIKTGHCVIVEIAYSIHYQFPLEDYKEADHEAPA